MWDNSPTNFADDVVEDTMKVAKDITNDMFVAIVLKSPIDTSRFVSNSNVSVGTPDTSFNEDKKLGRGGAMSVGVAKIAAVPVNKLANLHITNTTPYGDDLESGSSPQARNGVFLVSFLGVAQKYR